MDDQELTIAWRFTARAGKELEFEKVYGAGGDWATLFRSASGYRGARPYRSRQAPRRSLVIDRWSSAEAFARFKSSSSEEYRALDERCEELTADETHLGDFTEIA